jgi:hypothetical protein
MILAVLGFESERKIEIRTLYIDSRSIFLESLLGRLYEEELEFLVRARRFQFE